MIEYAGINVSKSGITRSRIKCKCKCGNECYAVVGDFIRGNHLSCGCIKGKHLRRYVYGGAKYERLFSIWRKLIYRVNDKNDKYYGGKGCVVCDEWYAYDVFAEWSINNGYDKTKQLDKDIKGNGLLYSPDTCCWVSPLDNSSNRSYI